jgi:Asp-tRNA(Asn)/Glu-tRNA(Gln) amidotransferase A subunit family amidase
LKPAYEELSTSGVVPLSRTLDHVGPLAATVTDAWHMFQALSDGPTARPLMQTAAASLKLGVPRSYFCELLDEGVRRTFDASVERLRSAGATIIDVVIPHAAFIAPIYVHILFGDASAFHAQALETMGDRYTRNVRLRLEVGRYVTAEDYVRALDGRRMLKQEVETALTGLDALLLPTLPIVAPPLGMTSVSIGGSEQPVRNVMLRLTQLFNITGHPAISLPCGTSSGLPCGIQLAGAAGQTDTLMQTALGVEAAIVA